MEMPTAKGEADMKRLPWCLAALLVVLQASGFAQEQPKGTTELDGTWQIISRNTEGFDWTEEDLKAIPVQRLVFRGNKLITLDKDGKVVSETPVKVYPKRVPPAIDMIGRDLFDPAETWTIKHIYSLKGDTLTLCWQFGPRAQRPKDFNAVEGSRLEVATYKRVPEK
jgi:uncharacterized protein (TIGR03067 family)